MNAVTLQFSVRYILLQVVSQAADEFHACGLTASVVDVDNDGFKLRVRNANDGTVTVFRVAITEAADLGERFSRR
jgi:hypothetical protein